MAAPSSSIVPVVLWGKQAPSHCISSVYLARDQRILATGCNDGQICIWDVDEGLKIIPRCLLFGHTATVSCLARGSSASEGSYLVSSSESGEMCVWDLSDGRCMESIKMDYIHTHIHSYVFSGASEVRLVCDGFYSEILVIDAFSLEIVYTLSSRVSSDWISAMHILRPTKSQDDKVVALTVSGTIKVWSVNGNISKGTQVFEQESKPIRCLKALTLTTCIYNQRTVLIVCANYWQVFDGEDFGLLCSLNSRPSERWVGGDFVAVDKVLVWSDLGKGYLYRLPSNDQRGLTSSCVVESKDFHSKASEAPLCYCVLTVQQEKLLACPPAMMFSLSTRGHFQKLLLRGDCEGKVSIWTIPEVTDKYLGQLLQESFDKPPVTTYSLQQAWKEINPPPPGILGHLDNPDGLSPKLTASIYLPLQGTLVCGRDDGSIIIVSATQTVMVQLLYGRHQQYDDWPPHQVLLGHNGAVTCLLYPHHINSRYDIAHLVSGGVDFSVCLWDIYTGSLLHTFCIHAGEITQLLVPPNNCSARVLQCICSVASDYSVALLGIKDRRCFMLASRHLFPVQVIKWRPLDDFMVVGCADGTVYIWQMETGHLDRVVHGLVAEEVLSACDENVANANARDAMANPAIHFFRGLKNRNLAAIRHAAARGLHHLAQTHQTTTSDGVEAQKNHSSPLLIQGLKTNPKDYDSHVLFFDIEALIVQLLTEEYSTMSPSALEAQGLVSQSEFHKVSSHTQNSSPDTQRKLANLLSKVMDTAENMGQKIQATAESVGIKPASGEGSQPKRGVGFPPANGKGSRRPNTVSMVETNLTMEIAQLLLSFLHAWGIDFELDEVCENKLGLLRPMCPISFGLLSRGGYMSLLLPFWQHKSSDLPLSKDIPQTHIRGVTGNRVKFDKTIPKELVELQQKTLAFISRGHWEVSTALTTHHLLATISIANTLMSMNSATFISEQERRRKLMRRLSRMDSKLKLPDVNQDQSGKEDDSSDVVQSRQAQIKQGWSLLAALHCVLLPDRICTTSYKHPRVEMLVRRWQDRCLEVREAAQALLLAELRRMGTAGRKALVEEWSPYLPNCFEPFSGTGGVPSSGASTPDVKQMSTTPGAKSEEGQELDEEDDDDSVQEGLEALNRDFFAKLTYCMIIFNLIRRHCN
ncbi:Rabconnectin-3B, isoform A [Chamberlinius hualienensis]